MPVLGNEMLVSAQVYRWDLSTGPKNAALVPYDFIATGGYASSPTGVETNDETKGLLTLTVSSEDPAVPSVDILIGGAPVAATDVPLKVYSVDPFEPWLIHNGPTVAGTYIYTLLFRLPNMEDEVIDVWEVTWTTS